MLIDGLSEEEFNLLQDLVTTNIVTIAESSTWAPIEEVCRKLTMNRAILDKIATARALQAPKVIDDDIPF